MTTTVTSAASPASAAAPACAPGAPGEPTFITEDCVDPAFNKPVIDTDERRTDPVPHRYVNGHFEGTKARFSFYFPDPDQYQGRFYQATHPALMVENAAPDDIEFTLSAGAYLVRTNMALYDLTGVESIKPDESEDGAYRVNAAAAKFSRVVAAEMYGNKRPFGYLYGGSGGSTQTIAGLQNTKGVWDGGVPYIMWTPSALPLNLTARLWALRVLSDNNRFPAVMDAVDPGGSGDIYAGLSKEEHQALEEATRMGFPPRGWYNWATIGYGSLIRNRLGKVIPAFDPTYADDFWTKPGYLGTDPAYSAQAVRVQQAATVLSVSGGQAKDDNKPSLTELTGKSQPKGRSLGGPGEPIEVELSSVPAGTKLGFDLILTSGPSEDAVIPITEVKGNKVVVGSGFGANTAVLNTIKAGDTVRVDNSWFLAMETYNRHQVPGPDEYGFNQYRGPDGKPLYPQRDILVAHKAADLANGGKITGDFNGKMIVVQALMDVHTFPWQADWYRTKVMNAKGDNYADSYRLYYIDYAQHVPVPGLEAAARTVLVRPAVRQALLYMSAWVEKGIEPPKSTNYKVVDTQVVVPDTAKDRLGIQPVVHLTANGGARADIKVGETVTFDAQIEMPPGTGKVVAVEWDFLGKGDYPETADIGTVRPSVSLKASHTYTKPGTYFPVLRATSQRDVDPDDPYHRIQNLGRVRVVVK